MSYPYSLSVADIVTAIDHEIKKATEKKDIARLADLQVIAGYLMQPAEAVADKETSRRFRILAARAANAREDLERKLER